MTATTHEKLELITRYYDACSRGDIDTLVESFTPDVTHYFLAPNLASTPVSGAEHLARYWRKVQAQLDGRWVVDRILADGDEAVIEWTLYWSPAGAGSRVCTRGTEWFCSFGVVGLVPDSGVTAALVRLLGHARAFELAVTGRRIPAAEAHQLGMVNQVGPADELLDEARELAKRLVAGPATAISLTKQLFAEAGDETEAHLLEREAESQGIAAASPEHQEALAAFLSRSRAR